MTSTRPAHFSRSRTRLTGGEGQRGVQSRDYSRVVPETATAEGADRLFRLSTMFSSNVDKFVSKIKDYASGEREKWEANRKIENERLGQEAVRVALDDPAGVDLALKNKDPAALASMSTLEGIDANRPEFIEAIKLAHGQNKAIQDYQEKFIPALQALDYMSGNPRIFRDEFTDAQMKGADPTFDYAYRKTFAHMSDEAINSWYAQQRAYLINRQIETAIDTVRSKVFGGEAVGIEDVYGLIGHSVGVAQGAEGKIKTRDRVISELFQMAHQTGHGGLMRALTQPDPKNNGLSLADLNRDLWDKALAGALHQYQQVKSVEAAEDLSRLNLLIAGVSSGTTTATVKTAAGDVPVDAEYILSELNAHFHRYGPSSQWEGAMKSAMAMLGKQIEEEAAYDAFYKGMDAGGQYPGAGAPYIPEKMLNEYGDKFVDHYTQNRLAAGDSPSQVVGRLAQLGAQHGGFGSQFNNRISHNLLAGNPEQVTEAYRFLAAVEKSRGEPGAAAAMLKDNMAKAKFDFMYTFVERFHGDPNQAVQMFQAAAKETGTTDWRGYITKAFPVDKERRAFIDGIIEEVSDNLGGVEVPFALRGIIEEEASRQLWMHSGVADPSSISEIVTEAVAKGMEDRVEIGYDPAAQSPVAIIRKTPRVVMNHDGSVQGMPPINLETHKQAGEAFQKDIVPTFGRMFGVKAVGITPNREAEKGYGALVVVENTSGVQGELIFPYGEIEQEEETIPGGISVAMPPKELPDGMRWNGKNVVIEKTNSPIRIGRFVIAPHPTIPGYAGVYYVGDTPKTHAEILSERRASLRARGEKLEAEKKRIAEETTKNREIAEERRREKQRSFVATGIPPIEPAPTYTPPGRAPYFDESTGKIVKQPEPVKEEKPQGRPIEEDIKDIKEAMGFLGQKLLPKEEPEDDRNFFERLYDKAKDAVSKAPGKATGSAVGGLVGGPIGGAVGGFVGEAVDETVKTIRKWFAAPSKEEAEKAGRGETPTQDEKWQSKFQKWLHRSNYDGYISGDTIHKASSIYFPRNQEEFEAAMAGSYQLASMRGNQWSPYGVGGIFQAASSMITTEEGYSSTSYKDGSSRSIGYGCNLKRKDFRNILERLGYNISKVWSGEQPIQKQHAVLLRDYELKRLHGVIREQLAGVAIPMHQQLALLDMAYNLGEGAIRDVVSFLRKGDTHGAAAAMLNKKPPASLPARTREVLVQRRIRNAYQLIGYKAYGGKTLKDLYQLST